MNTKSLIKLAEELAPKYDRMTSIVDPLERDEANSLAKTFRSLDNRDKLTALREARQVFLRYYKHDYDSETVKAFLDSFDKLIKEEMARKL